MSTPAVRVLATYLLCCQGQLAAHSSLLALPREALQSGPPPGSWFRGRPWRADCLALLAPRGWRITLFTHCVRSVQTDAPSQSLKRAVTRAPRAAALLSPSQIAQRRPELQGACIAIDVPLDGGTRQTRRWLGPTTGDLCAAESAAERLRRAPKLASSALQALTRRHCLTTVSAANGGSLAPLSRAVSTEGSRLAEPTRVP